MKPYGLLLTGGTSARMGRDKAAIEVDGVPLARRLSGMLASVVERALDVGSDGGALSGLASCQEDPPGGGPLAAVVAGWKALVAETGEKRPIVVLSCDLPDVEPETLAWLAAYPGGDVGELASVVPLVGGQPQYLCARWSVADVERAASQLASGASALRNVFGPDALYPGEDVWGPVASRHTFDDVDTPEDLALRGLAPPPGGDEWVALSRHRIDTATPAAWVADPACGAVVTFTGTVRDHADGRPGVDELAYEAYEEPALVAMSEIVQHARRRWECLARIAVLHRLGRLDVGEVAVVVAVSAPHRPEAFEAAAYVIDSVKEAVPIWKYERWSGDATHGPGEGWGTSARPIRRVEGR